MVALRSETDFVSKNEEFVALARELALQVAASNPLFVRRVHAHHLFPVLFPVWPGGCP